MLKIAICDDEKVFRDNINKYVAAYLNEKEISYEIDTFSSGKEIIDLGIEIKQYNIIFLDINMDDVDGIVTAQKIREYSSEIYIVFVTAYINYSLEGYKVDAIRYLLKNNTNLEASISECMDAILHKMNLVVKKKKFKFNEGEKEINIDNILYIESKLHKLQFYIMEDKIKIYNLYGTLNELENELKDFHFIRIHQSYLTNLKYIRSVKCYKVLLCNNQELLIPIISYLMDDLVKSSQKALENQVLRDQVSSYEREIMLQNKNMEALRSFRHDMKRHFAEISVLASTGEIEQIKNYVSAMENNLVESRRLGDSGNTALDTVLNYMLQRAVDKKIQLNVKVVVPSDLKLSAYDMNIIFGNLLENAIEAQKDVKNPSIDLEINYLMDSLVVEISNRCLQKVIFKGGLPVTTKQSVREHGYGLKNVKKVLDKYISTLDFECSDERFTVKILMKI